MITTDIQQFKQKFEAFVAQNAQMRNELDASRREIDGLRNQLAAKHEEITVLQERLNNRNVAGAVAGKHETDIDAARAKIAELMREIDKCIALLNV